MWGTPGTQAKKIPVLPVEAGEKSSDWGVKFITVRSSDGQYCFTSEFFPCAHP